MENLVNIRKKEKGFTIIEVVLVLAIAGLIFGMVFIALPSLQRSQRDAQRKNDLNRLNTSLTSYQSNNRGALPTDQASWNKFVGSYVRTAGDTFVDPSGTDYDVSITKNLLTEFDATVPVIKVTTSATCAGEDITTTGQSARKVAFQMKLEGSGTACANN